MSQARFSIVTITLNDLKGLVDTYASVAAQTCRDFEWLVVDGGSADGTVEYMQQIYHPKCKWISELDNGLYDAMNKGLERATGDYVIFMNSGDKFAGTNVLSRIASVLDEDGRNWDLVYGDALEIETGGNVLLKRARPTRFVNYGMFTHHQAILYARRAIGCMRYDSRYVIAGDYDFTCRLLAQGGSSLRLGFPVSINKRAGLSEKKAIIGRRENLTIQKAVLRLGLIRRAANYLAFLSSGFLRTHMRGLYDRLRFRHHAPLTDPRQATERDANRFYAGLNH